MGHHFCCCFPLRFGVFLISLIQTLGFGAMAAGAWYIVSGHVPETGETKFRNIAIGLGVFYSLMALLALVGFIGSLRRSVRSLKIYKSALVMVLLLSLALGGLYIWAVFAIPRDELVKHCINGSTDQPIIDTCNKVETGRTVKIGVIVSVVFSILIQLWAIAIVNQYGDKLLEEQAWRSNVAIPMTGGKYAYTSAARGSMEEVSAPLTGANYTYPYADTHHSYGAQGPYDPPHHPPPV